MRFHKKRDGILMIRPNGTGRYLTFFEAIMYRVFGKQPHD